MTREELDKLHRSVCETARVLMGNKNHDYAKETDIFRNFRRHGRLGILVRMDDKLCRLQSFLENGKFKVQDEGLIDTVKDIINYAILFAAYDDPGCYTEPRINGGKAESYAPSLSNGKSDVTREEGKGSVGGEVEGGCSCSCHGDGGRLYRKYGCLDCGYLHRHENPPQRSLGDATGTPY